MSGRLVRPGLEANLRNHEERIRRLERASDLDHLVWGGPYFNFNLPMWGGPKPATNFSAVIDSTRLHNWKLVHGHAGSFDDAIIGGPFPLAPGAYQLGFAGAGGPGYGSFTMSVAGAYPFQWDWFNPAGPPLLPDWIEVASYDLTQNGFGVPFVGLQLWNYLWTPDPSTDLLCTGGYNGASSLLGFDMQGGMGDEGVTDIYNKAAVINASGGLFEIGGITPAGGGYYFVKIQCSGLVEFSDMVLVNSGPLGGDA